jgi:hypothetical protein
VSVVNSSVRTIRPSLSCQAFENRLILTNTICICDLACYQPLFHIFETPLIGSGPKFWASRADFKNA